MILIPTACTTEHQDATEALLHTYIIQLITEKQKRALNDDRDWPDEFDEEINAELTVAGGDNVDLDLEEDMDDEDPLSHQLLVLMGTLYSKCYLNEWTSISFDKLVEAISWNPVFHNKSNVPQSPVDHQIAVALYQFGHYGNAASTIKIALWAGIGFGTVELVTYQMRNNGRRQKSGQKQDLVQSGGMASLELMEHSLQCMHDLHTLGIHGLTGNAII
ncbi:hypothetical protein Moror_8526 [Moniliophthora roreri MCA 2997]|uniref:Uncharacterized protein n=2 Tax=Moniliophthora roreri TaxID=221103 RepID=V2W6Q1_MONRO|nr:hypothetical protein Moror_8526 [Moniliophthora roreri MCA 2997]